MIIGFAGYAQVGKDTAAQALIEQGFTRLAFADILKTEVNTMLRSVGVADDTHDELQKKFWRDFLVFWGAKRRQIARDYWIQQIETDMTLNGLNRADVVITDVRYLNEVMWVIENGGHIIRLHRPGYMAHNEEESVSFHVIDQAQIPMKHIDNTGTIVELHNKIKALDF